ncbi:MAG TPA: hypothetical protein VNZ52_16505 [Candidatus Thermoplasmatota archaeon]|nr:hypothetical protein [Candidatus Thermoplasmatota archaeon]
MDASTAPAPAALAAALREARIGGAPPAGNLEPLAARSAARTALAVAELGLPVRFDPEARWDLLIEARPRIVRVRFPVSPPRTQVALGVVLSDMAAALPDAWDDPVVLGLDHSDRGLTEVELATALYGEATYFHPPARTPVPESPALEAARRRGFRELLQLHNLLPQNRMVVLPEDHGLFLRMPEAARFAGVLSLLPGGGVRFFVNPVAPAAEPDLLRRLAEDTRMGCV